MRKQGKGDDVVNTETLQLLHKANAIRLQAADLDLQQADTVANRAAWREAREAMRITGMQLITLRRSYTPTHPTACAPIDRPEAAILHRNRRTHGLECEGCSREIRINDRYRGFTDAEGPHAFCLSCGRPENRSPRTGGRAIRRWNADAYMQMLDRCTPPTRTGPLADVQTANDDLLDGSVAAGRDTHHLERTVHTQYFFDSVKLPWQMPVPEEISWDRWFITGNITHSEINAEPIDELEDERTPDIPDWTPKWIEGPRVGQRPWRVVEL